VCTLAIYFRAFDGFPVVVAANRDEFLLRPTDGPGALGEEIFGGRDRVHGGTWLAVNRRGMVAALLNRRSEAAADPTRRSRGLLCVDALRAPSAPHARRRIARESASDYNAFNLLVADRDEAWIATNHAGALAFTTLTPGPHLLTNLDLDDPTCPRIATSHRLFASLLESGAPAPPDPQFLARLREILARHDTPLDPRAPGLANSLCLHSPEYGTRSSTVLWLDTDGDWTYLHSPRPPCLGDYQPVPVTFSAAGSE
jgi:uncharacterized protein with NRDE domain